MEPRPKKATLADLLDFKRRNISPREQTVILTKIETILALDRAKAEASAKRCHGITKKGFRCRNAATQRGGYCYLHGG